MNTKMYLCLMVFLSAALFAGTVPEAVHGWKQLEKGVWYKQDADGSTRYFANSQGADWVYAQLNDHADQLVQAYEANPSEDLVKEIDDHIANMDQVMANLEKEGDLDPESLGCTTTQTINVETPTSLVADADARWYNSCWNIGTAYAKAQVTTNGLQSTDTQTRQGANVFSSARVEKTGSYQTCKSFALAYVSAPGAYLSDTSTKSSCPPVTLPLSAVLICTEGNGFFTTAEVRPTGGSGNFSYDWSYTGSGTLSSSGPHAYVEGFSSGFLCVRVTDNITGAIVNKHCPVDHTGGRDPDGPGDWPTPTGN